MAISQTQRELRRSRGRVIPEQVQQNIRERMRLLRLSRGRQLSELDPDEHMVAATTLGSYELHDMSSMRLYHLYGLAQFLDINFLELIAYLFDTEGNDSLIANRQTNSERIVRLMGYLSEDDQKLACDLVDAVVESRGRYAKSNITVHARRVDADVQGVQARSEDR